MRNGWGEGERSGIWGAETRTSRAEDRRSKDALERSDVDARGREKRGEIDGAVRFRVSIRVSILGEEGLGAEENEDVTTWKS